MSGTFPDPYADVCFGCIYGDVGQAWPTEARRRQDDAETFEVQQLSAMEQSDWNKARLDDLKSTVDRGFERMDVEFRDVRAGFARVDDELRSVRSEMKTGFDGIHRLLHRYSLVFIGALVALVLARGVGLG